MEMCGEVGKVRCGMEMCGEVGKVRCGMVRCGRDCWEPLPATVLLGCSAF